MKKLKKYRLIKTYPGSPKLSTEIIETQINSLCPVNECYINRKTFMLIGDDSFEIKNPENYPEFWEKVVEKDYEILCIKHKKSKCFYRNSIDLRNLNLYDIHSVKRLSDGKVFNIGENATTALNNYGPITAFEINCNRMYIRTNGSSKGTFSCNIKDLIVSELLFKTEDGVNIFKGDECWAIDKTDLDHLGKVDFRNNHPYDYALYFSNEKKAQQYIKENKPLFVTEDSVNIFKGDKAYECARNGKCYNKSNRFTPLNSERHNYTSIGKSWIVFSTEKKAEEYILLNKPCICLKDLIEAFFPKDYNFNNRKSEGAIEDISVNLLISLFKLKLKEK